MSRVLNFIFARSYFIHVVIGLSLTIIICGYFFRNYISDFIHDTVQIALDLEPQRDPVRSWTIKDEYGRRILTNGLCIMQPHSILHIQKIG